MRPQMGLGRVPVFLSTRGVDGGFLHCDVRFEGTLCLVGDFDFGFEVGFDGGDGGDGGGG